MDFEATTETTRTKKWTFDEDDIIEALKRHALDSGLHGGGVDLDDLEVSIKYKVQGNSAFVESAVVTLTQTTTVGV